MKKLAIYEPAMCCPTGVCGPSVDPELLRISTVINNLKNNGVDVERYNLTSNTKIFIENKVINKMLIKDGVDILPITIVNDEVVKTKAYPNDEELSNLLDVPVEYLRANRKESSDDCCCGGGCC